MLKRFIYASALLAFSFPVKGQIAGNSTFRFLSTTPSARIAALGGTSVAVADGDLNTALYNPALLSKLLQNNITFSYAGYLSDIGIGNFGYSHHFGKWGTYAASIQYISYGDFIQADESGNLQGTFKASEYAYQLGWALPLDSAFTLGVNLKYINSSLYSYKASGIATDIALLYDNKRGFSATALVKNMGKQLKQYDAAIETAPLPMDVQIGVSKKLNKAPIRLSLFLQQLQKWDLSYDKPTDPNSGSSLDGSQTATDENKSKGTYYNILRHLVPSAELFPTGPFNVRIGYNFLRATDYSYTEVRSLFDGISFGFGLRTSKFSIGYGRSVYHSSFATNHFTLSVNLNGFYHKKNKI